MIQKQIFDKPTKFTVTIFCLIVLSSCLIYLMDFAPIFAASESSPTITLYPTINDFNVVQGSTKEIELYIKNDTDLDTSFKIYPAEIDIQRYLDSNELIILDNTEISSWITIPDSITVSSMETVNITGNILVPSNTKQKTYFPVIVFEQLQSNNSKTESSSESNNGQSINTKIIAYIYLTVLDSTGSRSEDLQIKSFSTEKQITWERKNNFVVEYENSGEIMSKPRGYIELTVTPGSLVLDTDLVINNKFSYILPQLTRKEELTWQHETNIRSILPLIKIKSSAKLFSTDGVLVSEKEISFWYIDVTKLILWIIAIITIFGLLYILKFTRNRKKQNI